MGGVRIAGLALPAIGFPCLGVIFHDGFDFSYVALIPYDGSGIPDGNSAELSTETANFTFTPMMDTVSRRIVWKQQGSVWIIGEHGTGEANIRSGNSPNGTIFSPWWHPDGSKILYMAAIADDISSPDEIQTIDPDGANQTTLYTAPNTTKRLGPASYNCDGTRIAFCQLASSTTLDLITMNADGSNVQTIDTLPTQLSAVQFDSPIWAWYTANADRLVVGNTNTLASPTRIAINYDGSGSTTLDTGTTRSNPCHFAVMPGDVYYAVRLADGTKIQKVALDGSGVTDILTTSASVTTINQFASAPCGNNRLYFDSSDDVWSCAMDGTDERNETASTARNYGLTG